MGYVIDAKILRYGNQVVLARSCDECEDQYFFDLRETEFAGCVVCHSCAPSKKINYDWINSKLGGVYIKEVSNRVEQDYKKARRSTKNYKRIFKIYEGVCQYCYSPGDTVEHIVPVVYGGTNSLANLTVACKRCNCIAGSMVFDSFNQKLEYVRSKIKNPNRICERK